MQTNTDTTEKPNTMYILFGWEAIEARPNLDPFEGVLRSYEDGLVYTSDVHLKHHARRGIKAAAELDFGLQNPEIYYDKAGEGDDGKARSVEDRVKAIQKTRSNVKSGNDVYNTCLDLPLFGFVWAKKGEAFHRNGAANTIVRPVTFHTPKVLSLGRNNAFANDGAAASGSASIDSLEYGFFLGLIEVNLNTLAENIADHKELQGVDKWVDLLVKGLWRAYTSHRYPSFTQRSQFAKFLLAWEPASTDINPIHPRDLAKLIKDEEVLNSVQAQEALKKVLPKLLKGWQYSKNGEKTRIEAGTFLSEVLDSAAG